MFLGHIFIESKRITNYSYFEQHQERVIIEFLVSENISFKSSLFTSYNIVMPGFKPIEPDPHSSSPCTLFIVSEVSYTK